MIVSDIETGLVSDINPSFTQLFGFADHEILGKRTLDVGFWPSKEARDRTVRDMRERGELRRGCRKRKAAQDGSDTVDA